MNKAIVLGYLGFTREALDALTGIADLQNNHLYHAAMGDFYKILGDVRNSTDAYERALTLTQSKSEKELLQRKKENQRNN